MGRESYDIRMLALDECGLHARIAPIADGVEELCFAVQAMGQGACIAKGERVFFKGQEVWDFEIPFDTITRSEIASRIDLRLLIVSGSDVDAVRDMGRVNGTEALRADDVTRTVLRGFLESARCVGERVLVPYVDAESFLTLLDYRSDLDALDTVPPWPKMSLALTNKIAFKLLGKHPGTVASLLAMERAQLESAIAPTAKGIAVSLDEIYNLKLNPVGCFVTTKSVRVDAIAWHKDVLSLCLSCQSLPNWLITEARWSIVLQVESGETFVYACEALEANGSLKLLASIRLAELCELAEAAHACLSAFLSLRCEWGRWSFECKALGKRSDSAAIESLLTGHHRGACAHIVPYTGDKGDIRLMSVARTASSGPSDMLQAKAPVFENMLLRAALAKGVDCLGACAEALEDGQVRTAVHIERDGSVTCRCSVEGWSIDLDIGDLPCAARATLLDEGKPIDVLGDNDVHDMQFRALYAMIVELDELCMANGIEYFLAGGTLLGAIRHHGFIPWDHDIDIYMRDTEFEKLKAVWAAGKFPLGRRLDCVDNDPLYPEQLGRYVNCETTRFNPTKPRGLGGIGGAGMFIDIFVLVPLAGRSTLEQVDHLQDFIVYEELRNRFQRKHSFRPLSMVRKLEEALQTWDEKGYDAALAEWQSKAEAMREEGSPMVGSRSAGTLSPYGRTMRSAWFDSSQRVTMLDHEFSIPGGGRELLESVYGFNWRVYPSRRHIPLDEGIYNSATVPYKVIVEEALEAVSRDEVLTTYGNHKHAQLRELVMRGRIDAARESLMQLENAEILRESLASNPIDFESCITEGRWGELDAYFAQYYSLQGMGGYGRLRHYLPISPIEFKAAILNLLCNRNDIPLATKLVRSRMLDGGPLEPYERAASEALDMVFELRNRIEDHDIGAARRLLGELNGRISGVVFATQVELMLDVFEAKDEDDVQSVLARCRAEYAARPHPYTLTSLAECFLRLGNRGAALAAFKCVQEETLDGMLLNYLDARVEEVF